MDHLVGPSRPYKTLKIPFLGEMYDELGFDGYPSRKQWTIADLVKSACSFDQAAVLQRTTVQDAVRYLRALSTCAVENKYTVLLNDSIELLDTLIVDHNSTVAAGELAPTSVSSVQNPPTLSDALRCMLSKHDELKSTGRYDEAATVWQKDKPLLLKLSVFIPNNAGKLSEDGLSIQEGLCLLPYLDFAVSHMCEPYILDVQKDGQRSTRAAYGFLQSWLYFGTLHEIFGILNIKIDLTNYINDEEGSITTRHLTTHLSLWAEKEKKASAESRTQRIESIDAVLRTAMAMVNDFEDDSRPLPASSIVFSIGMLLLTLRNAAFRIYDLALGYTRTKNCKFLGSLFESAGWCPYQVAKLQDLYHPWSQYYAYLLGPPGDLRRHSQCQRESCVANQVTEVLYETKHIAVKDGKCQLCYLINGFMDESGNLDTGPPDEDLHWVPDMQTVIDILEKGRIPIISVSNIYLGGMDLQPEIVEYRTDMRFVAISHVWADGRGNPHRNSLPWCQLLELRRYLAPLQPGGELDRHYFWIDTLCVPLRPSASRRLAIVNMRQTYQQAHAVLVLDSGLIASKRPPSTLECLAQIALSNWGSRLWTFQEANLAKDLRCVFSGNEIVDMNDLMPSEQDLADQSADLNGFVSKVRIELLENSSWIMHLHGTPYFNPFLSIWYGISWRTTSKPEDETICVGTLLGLDVGKITETPTAPDHQITQMKRLLTLQGRFPDSIIFGDFARMHEDGFRWGPQSFLVHGRLNYIKHPTVGPFKSSKLTDRGLLVKFPGLILPSATAQIPIVDQKMFGLKISTGSIAEAEGPEDKILKFLTVTLVIPKGDHADNWDFTNQISLAIILDSPLQTVPTDSDLSHNQRVGALVSMYAMEGGVRYSRFLCLVNTKNVQFKGSDTFLDEFTSPWVREMVEGELIDNVTLLNNEQDWCVG
ncbi:hypothetical protein AU210_003635 [Fusarium oxysporum f. sp. radicis-cucumerinum]|uniref:Heterokaryon incompatibility domain-containing protein n=2 Tax=Fusarium oxysporum TaxID=5507 RepID=A0A2H3HCV6_FUSOX|nr:hypothetical protein AU210_003635 [Fusarium oxysporum f. sp. radicis-cucumerinum]RKK26715.1 hypothetical protein BFJ67_g16506 [Fusarium oxysporum f. sp. cepae]RKK27445.1 hypothetical protein BFJ66_g16645 [Fusarium oxysporum f. sp. cepae]